MKSLTIATPFFNEEDGLDNYFEVLKKINQLLINKINVKYLFIDDGSTDNTNKKLKSFKIDNKNFNIEIFTHDINSGYGKTLQNSIKLCNTDYLITYDSDCSYDYKLIDKLVNLIKKNDYDIINISYKLAEQKNNLSLYRNTLSWGSSFINNFFFPVIKKNNISVLTCSFRIYKTSKIKNIILKSDDFNCCAELLIKSLISGLIVKEIPGQNKGRKYGTSKMKVVKNIFNTFKTIFQIKTNN